jgi:hypothetical protein
VAVKLVVVTPAVCAAMARWVVYAVLLGAPAASGFSPAHHGGFAARSPPCRMMATDDDPTATWRSWVLPLVGGGSAGGGAGSARDVANAPPAPESYAAARAAADAARASSASVASRAARRGVDDLDQRSKKATGMGKKKKSTKLTRALSETSIGKVRTKSYSRLVHAAFIRAYAY